METSYFMKTKIRLAKHEDAKNIENLARPIWIEHYTPLIGLAQVNYMLDKFQSESAIFAQIEQNYDYYLVESINSENDEQMVGFFCIQEREKSLFISKFYLSSSARGQGLGRKMMVFIENIAKTSQKEQLMLTVNKQNPSLNVYLRLGFEKTEDVTFDIGNGYVMDDYVMTKLLANIT